MLRICAVVLVALALWGAVGWHRVRQFEQRALAEQLQASENARETERLANRANTRINDELHTLTQQRNAAARQSAKRMRRLAEARAAADAAAASCQRYEGPAVDVIPPAVRDAVGELIDEADDVADRLRACQAYVRDVVRPDGAQTDVR